MTRLQVSDHPDAHDRLLGAEVVLLAQAASNLPPRDLWPPDRLTSHTLTRQRNALALWVARAGEDVVGHLLIELVGDGPYQAITDPRIAAARDERRLVSAGALAVDPLWWGQGVARALVSHALTWYLQHPELTLVAAVWDEPAAHAWVRGVGEMIDEVPELRTRLIMIDAAHAHAFLESGQ